MSTVRPTRLKKSQIAIAMAAGHWHASGAASKVQVTGRRESGVSATGEGYPGGREREREREREGGGGARVSHCGGGWCGEVSTGRRKKEPLLAVHIFLHFVL